MNERDLEHDNARLLWIIDKREIEITRLRALVDAKDAAFAQLATCCFLELCPACAQAINTAHDKE